MTTAYSGGKTWSAGPPPDTFSASDANTYIRDDVTAAASPPDARVYRSAIQTVLDATDTSVQFNLEVHDTDTIHDTVTNNTRLTVPSGFGGRWLITAGVQLGANATGFRRLGWSTNGGAIQWMSTVPAATAVTTDLTFAEVLPLAAADYVEIWVHQTSTVTINLTWATATFSLLRWD